MILLESSDEEEEKNEDKEKEKEKEKEDEDEDVVTGDIEDEDRLDAEPEDTEDIDQLGDRIDAACPAGEDRGKDRGGKKDSPSKGGEEVSCTDSIGSVPVIRGESLSVVHPCPSVSQSVSQSHLAG